MPQIPKHTKEIILGETIEVVGFGSFELCHLILFVGSCLDIRICA